MYSPRFCPHPPRTCWGKLWWAHRLISAAQTLFKSRHPAQNDKSRRRSLDPVFGVDSENQGFGSPFTDSGRALIESSVFGAPNLELAARGHIPWLYEPYFRNQRRRLVPCAGRQDFSTLAIPLVTYTCTCTCTCVRTLGKIDPAQNPVILP